jgi:hypothetical protein
MGAPPTVVCGITVDHSPSGVGLYDLTRPDSIVLVPWQPKGVLVRTSGGCGGGSDLTIDPATSMTFDAIVRSEDGKVVVGRLQWAQTTSFGEATAFQAGRTLGTLAIQPTAR